VLAGIRGIQFYIPTIAAYGVMSAWFVSVALTVTFRRLLKDDPMHRAATGILLRRPGR
jgi:hypothetical protein